MAGMTNCTCHDVPLENCPTIQECVGLSKLLYPKPKIYLTYRNMDMTEGRGPMHLVKVDLKMSDAVLFAMRQCGVMGVKNTQHVCNRPWRHHDGFMEGTQLVEGDWEVFEVNA